jgi:hypothetical protein
VPMQRQPTARPACEIELALRARRSAGDAATPGASRATGSVEGEAVLARDRV